MQLKTVHLRGIILLLCCISLRSADRDEESSAPISLVSPTQSDSAQKPLIIFVAPPFAGQEEIYKSLKILLSDHYGKSTFLISSEKSKESKQNLAHKKGSTTSELEQVLEKYEHSGEIEKMVLEDSGKMPDKYDEKHYRKSMKFLIETRDRLKNPENKACFYAMFFWTKDQLVGKRFADFLAHHHGQYFLIKVMSKLEKANTRLAADVLQNSKFPDAVLSLKKETLKNEYKGQRKKFTAFDESLFHLCIDTTHCNDLKKVANVDNPPTSPRPYTNDITDPFSPRKLERATKVEKSIGGSGYDDAAAKIAFLLNLKTDEQEFQKRIQ